MLRSMTAYGRSEAAACDGQLSWEIRSVNHRYLELSFRLPEDLRAVEPLARTKIAKRLKRGKVDVFLRFQTAKVGTHELNVDFQLAEQVIAATGRISESVRDSKESVAPIDALRILSWPGVVGQAERDDKALQGEAMSLLDAALDDYMAAREREGEKTRVMLAERCDAIEQIVIDVRKIRPAVVERLHDKLRSRIADLDVEVDTGRLEQELVYSAQKLDVDEELDRLDAHISEMREIFERDEPVGRRLDFLIQEFNREANTLGSKAADSDTTGFSVDLKVLIEQMREQVQNLE